MRLPLSLLIVTAWVAAPEAWAQHAASRPAEIQRTAFRPAAAQQVAAPLRLKAVHSRLSSSLHSRSRATDGIPPNLMVIMLIAELRRQIAASNHTGN